MPHFADGLLIVLTAFVLPVALFGGMAWVVSWRVK